jgi:hypothetical protein
VTTTKTIEILIKGPEVDMRVIVGITWAEDGEVIVVI